MIRMPNAVEKAKSTAETLEEGSAEREALAGLLSEYRQLQGRYNYVCAEGEPQPSHTQPLDEADPLEGLPGQWRDEADTLRGYGAEGQAETLKRCASELDIALRAFQREELTLRQAAGWSGYSVKRLRELVHEGKIPDNRPDGSQGTIRVRRCDLPRKPAADREALSPADRLYSKLSR